MVRSNGRERIGWYFYDWANSAFATTVVTVFLGPYLTSITKAAADVDGFIHPLGLKVHAGSFYPYLVSVSVLLQALLHRRNVIFEDLVLPCRNRLLG